MLGAIVGDIVGSVYEWNNIKTKDFPLFRDDCFFTDDTVMTCAVAERNTHRRGPLNAEVVTDAVPILPDRHSVSHP